MIVDNNGRFPRGFLYPNIKGRILNKFKDQINQYNEIFNRTRISFS